MAVFKAENVAKYDAGGSGDNYISDGYIKTVEKVWLDSCTIGTTALGSTDTILLGYVPKNKKIIEVVVQMPALSEDEGTYATILLGSASTVVITVASTFLGIMRADASAEDTVDILTASTLRMSGDKMGTVTNKRVGIYLKVMTINGIEVGLTAGTIRSIIRYT